MTAFLALLKNDIKLFLRDWKACVLLLALPILFISLFVYVMTAYMNKSNFVDPFPIALADNEDTTQTRVLARQLDEIEIFDKVLKTDEESAKELIRQNRIAAAVIIPKGFSESILSGENKPVTVIGNKSMPLQSFIVKNFFQGVANLFSAGESAWNTMDYYYKKEGFKSGETARDYDQSVTRLLMESLSRNEIYADIDNPHVFNLTPAEYFTAALIVIFLMFAGMPGMKLLVWERCYGITRRLGSTPVKLRHVVLSKFIVSAMLSIVQFGVVIAVTSVVFKNYWGAPARNILMLFGAIIFAVSAWSVFVSSISRTPAAADIIGNLGILLMAVIGGSIYPLTYMPEIVRDLSRLTINRWAMDGFMVLFSGNDALSVAGYAYPLLIIGLVMLAASAGFMKLGRR